MVKVDVWAIIEVPTSTEVRDFVVSFNNMGLSTDVLSILMEEE